MGSESSFWRTLDKNMKEHWIAERIENSAKQGTPDVYFTMKATGKMGWIELKYAHKWPRRPSTPMRFKHFTPQQKNFFRRHTKYGGRLYIMIQVQRDYFLFKGSDYSLIGDTIRSDMEWYSLSWWKNRIDYEDLVFFLSNP